MTIVRSAKQVPPRQTLSFDKSLREISMFFEGKDEVHKSLRRLIKRLERNDITYAIIGGMALAAYHFRRATEDVDILLARAGFEEFKRLFVPKNYAPVPGRGRRFVDRANKVTLDILLTGLYPGSGKPGPIAFPDPADVSRTVEKYQVLNLDTFVQLKLAARRHQDFADVVNLIRHNDLDESFADKLHLSVRGDYIECLEEKRREDEYEARNG
jgi:hypothetical protein